MRSIGPRRANALTRRVLRRIFQGLPAFVFLTACRNSTEPDAGPIEIVSRVDAMFPGQQESLLVADDSVLTDPSTVEWASLDPGVATVDSSGVVSALLTGAASIVASAATGSDTLTFRVIEPPTGRIVFVGIEQEPQPEDKFRLYEIQANGQGLRPFASYLFNVGPPAFSPDGSMLAVDAYDPPRVLILSPDASRLLYRPTEGLACGASVPAWAPDSRSIAFSSCASGAFEVWVSALDGSSRRQLTQFAQFAAPLMTFTPDGAALIVRVFVRDSGSVNPQAGQTELFRVDTATGVVRRLTTTPEDEEGPFVDAARSTLYYTRTIPSAPGSRPTAEAEAVFRSDLDLQSEEQITPLGLDLAGFPFEARSPHTSPDGEWLVFSQTTEQYPLPGIRLGDRMTIRTAPELFVMRLQDGIKVRLTHFWSAVQPSWGP